MSTVSHYFCIFCNFKCEEYVNAFNHYNSHMFVSGNCEVCDYSKLVVYKSADTRYCTDFRDDLSMKCFVEYKADPSDLSIKCERCHLCKEQFFGHNVGPKLPPENGLMINVTHYWINKFLSYQRKILGTSYENILLANKVCVECVVCQYLLGKYASNGGDMNRIEYIRDNKVEHCYQHMRYDPNSTLIKSCIDRSGSPLSLKPIVKLEVFIDHCCDTFFTGSEQIDNNDSVVNIGNIDGNITIQDSECLSCSEATETISQLSPIYEELAPILAKLSAVESEIADTNSRVDRIGSELENTKSKNEKIQNNIMSDSTLDYFANTTASLSVKLNVVESELNTIKSERNEVIPPATVAYFASPNAPIGWLKADGQTVSRVQYSNLFATIGTTFGSGDGSTTFTLPDLRGEFIRGWSDGRDVDKTRAFGSFQWGSSIPMSGFSSKGSINARSIAFAGVSFDSSEHKVEPGETRYGITYPSGSYITNIGGNSFSQVTSWYV